MEKHQYLDKAQLEDLQWRRLKNMIQHAYQNCAFYKKRMDQAGLNPGSINSIESFRKIPLLTKEDIQGNLKELTAKSIPSDKLVANKTGGSTGKPLNYFHDQERIYSMEAAAIRHDRWAGKDEGDKFAGLWGARHDWSQVQTINTWLQKQTRRPYAGAGFFVFDR